MRYDTIRYCTSLHCTVLYYTVLYYTIIYYTILCYTTQGAHPELLFGAQLFGWGDDTVGNPDRGQIYQFELFELVLLLKLDKQLPVEQFEAAVSQSAVPSPLLIVLRV